MAISYPAAALPTRLQHRLSAATLCRAPFNASPHHKAPRLCTQRVVIIQRTTVPDDPEVHRQMRSTASFRFQQ
jgi:hypothetical protein